MMIIKIYSNIIYFNILLFLGKYSCPYLALVHNFKPFSFKMKQQLLSVSLRETHLSLYIWHERAGRSLGWCLLTNPSSVYR